MEKVSAWDIRVFLVCLASFILRILHIGDGVGGYHGFNEGMYLLKARTVLADPFSFPALKGINPFVTPPPGLDYVLATAYTLTGESVAIGRLISISFGLAALAIIYLIGKLIYDEKTGFIAASFAAFAPVHVLVGRNIQTDMPVFCFILAAAYAYLRYMRKQSTNNMLIFGLAFGAGFWFKQTALFILVLAILHETIRHKGLKWVKDPQIKFAAIGLLFPLLYILISLSIDPAAFQWALDYTVKGVAKRSTLNFGVVFAELVWGVCPPIFLAGLIGMFKARRSKDDSERFLLIFSGFFLVFYLFYNYHSYYLLPLILPFSVFAAKAVSMLKINMQKAVVASIIIFCALNSFLLLGAVKWGFDGLSTLPARIGDKPSTSVYFSPMVKDSYGPILEYYLWQAKLNSSKNYVPSDQDAYFLLNRREFDISKLSKDDVKKLSDDSLMQEYYGLVIGPLQLFVKIENIHAYRLSGFDLSLTDELGLGPRIVFSGPEFYVVRKT